MPRRHREPSDREIAAAFGIGPKRAREIRATAEEEDRFFLELMRPYRHLIRPAVERIAQKRLTDEERALVNTRPSEAVRTYGNEALLHPAFWVKVWSLAQQIANPFAVESYYVRADGTPDLRRPTWIDERRNDDEVKAAKRELERVLRFLIRGKRHRPPRTYRDERTLFRFEELEGKNKLEGQGKLEKQLIAEIARERKNLHSRLPAGLPASMGHPGGHTLAAIRSQISRARNRLEKPRRAFRERPRRRHLPEKD